MASCTRFCSCIVMQFIPTSYQSLCQFSWLTWMKNEKVCQHFFRFSSSLTQGHRLNALSRGNEVALTTRSAYGTPPRGAVGASSLNRQPARSGPVVLVLAWIAPEGAEQVTRTLLNT
jgi:hypothetical protein